MSWHHHQHPIFTHIPFCTVICPPEPHKPILMWSCAHRSARPLPSSLAPTSHLHTHSLHSLLLLSHAPGLTLSIFPVRYSHLHIRVTHVLLVSISIHCLMSHCHIVFIHLVYSLMQFIIDSHGAMPSLL